MLSKPWWSVPGYLWSLLIPHVLLSQRLPSVRIIRLIRFYRYLHLRFHGGWTDPEGLKAGRDTTLCLFTYCIKISWVLSHPQTVWFGLQALESTHALPGKFRYLVGGKCLDISLSFFTQLHKMSPDHLLFGACTQMLNIAGFVQAAINSSKCSCDDKEVYQSDPFSPWTSSARFRLFAKTLDKLSALIEPPTTKLMHKLFVWCRLRCCPVLLQHPWQECHLVALNICYLQMTWELSDIPKKRKLPCHLQSEKNRKMHKSRVICKVPQKKNHMTWDLCNCLRPKKMQNMSFHIPHEQRYTYALPGKFRYLVGGKCLDISLSFFTQLHKMSPEHLLFGACTQMLNIAGFVQAAINSSKCSCDDKEVYQSDPFSPWTSSARFRLFAKTLDKLSALIEPPTTKLMHKLFVWCRLRCCPVLLQHPWQECHLVALNICYLQMTWELSDIPKKRKLPCHLQSEKNRKMHKSRVICKVPQKKNHMTWDLCNCLRPKKMQNMSFHIPHEQRYTYLLAVRIIQNFTSVPILDVPSPVVNSFSHLMTCHFPFWTFVFSRKSHVMCKFDHLFLCHLPKTWKNTCPLGRRITPMSCVKKKTIAKSIDKSHVMCQKTSAKSAAKSRVICAYYSRIRLSCGKQL